MSVQALPVLGELLARDWLLVGVGNEMRGDDAFGPLLARSLIREGLPALDAGTAPENVTGAVRARAPSVVVLADAVDFGGLPGEVRLLEPGSLAAGGSTTHDAGLGLLAAFLEAELGCRVVLLACQPARTGFGEPPGPATEQAVDALVAAFLAPR